MTIRKAVEDLVRAGALPSEAEASPDELEKWKHLLEAVEAPVSDAEAQALVGVFGPDGCFGLAWSVLHLIETAPSALTATYSQNSRNEWVELLEERRSGQ
jgi:hypothetical protein